MPTINKLKHHVIKELNTYDHSKLYDHKWERLRKAYLLQHPLCEMCLKEGKTVAAQEVHHIIPISTGKDILHMKYLALDYNNLMALCKECHHKIHNRMRKESKGHSQL